MRDRGFKNGMLDEFYLYDRVLTPEEMKILAGNQPIRTERVVNFSSGCLQQLLSKHEQLYTERKSLEINGNDSLRLW